MWRRDEELRVESALDAERFIEDVGFANTLTDGRRAGPRSDIAVCDGHVSLPRKQSEGRRTTKRTGDQRLEVRRQKAGGRRQKAEAGNRSREPAVRRSAKAGVRCQTQQQLATAIYLHRRRG